MFLLIGVSIAIGIVVSLLGYAFVMYCVPRLPKSPIVRQLMGAPVGCIPVVAGIYLTYLADPFVNLATRAERGLFLTIWLGISLVSVIFVLIKAEQKKKAGTYWRWKD